MMTLTFDESPPVATFDGAGRPVHTWRSPGWVTLRVDDDTLVSANQVELEVTSEEPPVVRLVAWMDRSLVYKLSLAAPHPLLTEERLLARSPHRPLRLEFHAIDELVQGLQRALDAGEDLESCVARTGDGGFPAFFDLDHYQLAGLHQAAE